MFLVSLKLFAADVPKSQRGCSFALGPINFVFRWVSEYIEHKELELWSNSLEGKAYLAQSDQFHKDIDDAQIKFFTEILLPSLSPELQKRIQAYRPESFLGISATITNLDYLIQRFFYHQEDKTKNITLELIGKDFFLKETQSGTPAIPYSSIRWDFNMAERIRFFPKEFWNDAAVDELFSIVFQIIREFPKIFSKLNVTINQNGNVEISKITKTKTPEAEITD